MKYLILLLCIVNISCASIYVTRDSEGRIFKISQGGFMPVKGKIGDCELDTKMSLFDFNLNKE